jgi:NIPSNAP
MIIEHRTYTLYPGKMAAFMSIYLPAPLELQRRILGNLIGYFTVEAGTLNQLVHLWGYESFEDRARRRAQLLAEPVWQEYLAKAMPLFQLQESKILLATAFSPIK